jgi:hypothetical protein
VFGVGVGDQAAGRIPQGEFGLAEEGLVAGGDEATGHVEDGVRRATTNPRRQFLGLLFQRGSKGFAHGVSYQE